MANKQIKDLQVRSSMDETVNLPCDDASQTWRVTGAQILAWIKASLVPYSALGDIIYAGASAVATRLAGNTTTTAKVLMQTGTGSVSAAPAWVTPPFAPLVRPRAELQFQAQAGYGSTATKIPYYTNTRVNQPGTAMSSVNNSTLGCAVTILEAGLYFIKHQFTNAVSTPGYIGVSKNAASTTTNISGLTYGTDLVGQLELPSQAGITPTWCYAEMVYLAVNDVIRPHTIGQATGGNTECVFSIAKIA